MDELVGEVKRWKERADALMTEVESLRDRAVCSGCGQDTDEGGVCHTGGCDSGELIPSSDLPGAMLAAMEARNEERDEWCFDWEALRAEAKGLEAQAEQLRAERDAALTARRDEILARKRAQGREQRLQQALRDIGLASTITHAWKIARAALTATEDANDA